MTPRAFQALLLLVVACAPQRAPAQDPDTRPVEVTVPPGHGQLAQEVITLQLRSGDVEIRFTPLDPRITRLLAPDAWRSLEDLVARYQPQVDSVARRLGIRNPGLVLVSFYALTPEARFDPQLLTVSSHNRLLRAAAVLPLSASFSAQQLAIRERAMGLYIFDELVPVTEPFSIEYLGSSTTEWERRLARFDRERARIQTRTGSDSGEGQP